MSNATALINAEDWSVFEIMNKTAVFNESVLLEARASFKDLQKRKIFINKSFDESNWLLNDEYSHRGINFGVNKAAYTKYYEKDFGFSLKQFIDYLKAFVVLSVGKLASVTLQSFVKDIRKLILINPEDLYETELKLVSPLQTESFFELLPVKNDCIMEILLEFVYQQFGSDTNSRRKLCDFVSYFTFDRIIDQYWRIENDQNEKLFYFPVYLWWKVTAIVPTRPREFLLTPRNCLKKDGDDYILILRKNKIKGGERKIHYNIAEDYDFFQCKIPKELAHEIEEYIRLTEIYPENELNGLFRAEPHYAKFNVSVNMYSRYYTYVNLSTALQYFYNEIIREKYRYHVIWDKNEKIEYSFEKKEIQYIQLGDTRHISMINAIAEGVSPDIIMQMAAHENVEMCNHYYSNMSTFIECRTYAKYQQTLSDEAHYVLGSNFYAPSRENIPYVELENGGKCYSAKMAVNDISDCINASGNYGEIGYCTNCPYYRTGEHNFFFTDIDIYRNKIDTNMDFLKELVRQVRAKKATEADIQQEILKFQNNKYLFETSIRRKYEEERRKEHGTSEKNQ